MNTINILTAAFIALSTSLTFAVPAKAQQTCYSFNTNGGTVTNCY